MGVGRVDLSTGVGLLPLRVSRTSYIWHLLDSGEWASLWTRRRLGQSCSPVMQLKDPRPPLRTRRVSSLKLRRGVETGTRDQGRKGESPGERKKRRVLLIGPDS